MTVVACDISKWSADLTTRSGLRLHVRPGDRTDLGALEELYRHVSPEDLRFRFFASVKAVSREQLLAMLTGDGVTTFLAFDETGLPLACCTLADEPGSDTADVTLSVRADAKGQGVSWSLLDHVLHYALAHGLKLVTAVESGDDRAAINLEREMGFVARLTSADPVELTLSKSIE